jgi:hypothetical protein
MSVHQVLTWLCERPRGDFTVGWILRRGWPGFASVVLLPKQLELGRAARLVERVIFLGSMAAFIYYGGLPLGSLGQVNSFIDVVVLVAIVKVVAIVAGWAVQFSVRIIAYIVGGIERLAPRRPIDLGRYGSNREKNK